MNKYLALFTFLILSNSIWAQAPDIVVDWGPIMKSKEIDFDQVIGVQGDDFYTFGTPTHTGMFSGMKALMSKREYNVSCYDMKKMRMKYKKVMEDFEYKGNNAYLEETMINPSGEIDLYFIAYDRKAERKYLVFRTMDNNGRFSPAKELASITATRRHKGDFTIKTSKDSTLLLVYADPPYERKGDEKFELKVFDRSHNLIWERGIVLPYTDKYFKLSETTITNDGDVFVLGFAEPDKSKGERRERRASNEYWKLYRIAQNENDIIEYDLDLADKFVSSVAINADFGQGMMGIAGFYTDKRRGGIGGSLFYTIDQKSLDPVTTSLREFDKTFLLNFMSERKARKGKDLKGFKFREFIRREDGGAVVVAEQHQVVVTTHTNANGVTTTTYTYYYNDLIVLNINPDGNVEWASHVPKTQVTKNDGGNYSGYLLIVEENRLHFIYNDHRKNADRIAKGKDPKNMGRVSKAMAVIATVEADGKVVYDQLFRNKDFAAILVPRRSHQASRNEVIMFGEKGSKSRFGNLKFQ